MDNNFNRVRLCGRAAGEPALSHINHGEHFYRFPLSVERLSGQEDLLPVNQYSRCGDKLQRVNAVVIHYVGKPNTTAWQNRSYFENLATTGETSASSNLIVGMEGETLLCVPLDEVAYCSNDRNYDTVSIEFCHPDAEGKPNQATYDTLVKLTAWLCDLYGLDAKEGVIRHYDVTGKQCPMYFVQNAAEWTQFQSDVAKAMKQQK